MMKMSEFKKAVDEANNVFVRVQLNEGTFALVKTTKTSLRKECRRQLLAGELVDATFTELRNLIIG